MYNENMYNKTDVGMPSNPLPPMIHKAQHD